MGRIIILVGWATIILIYIYIYISYFFDNILGILGWAPVRNRDDLSLGFMVDILK